ncbi:hypothetical protein Tamer19_67330 [Cupriavidus sp. TA19]|nr:hypothetical protein Tamer19_67330 [Cupriavidus sp. TA19]
MTTGSDGRGSSLQVRRVRLRTAGSTQASKHLLDAAGQGKQLTVATSDRIELEPALSSDAMEAMEAII